MHRIKTSLLTAAALLGTSNPSLAQTGPADDVSGPRFLLASAGAASPVRTDPGRVPLLRTRIAVHFNHVTLKDALDDISAKSGLHLYYSHATVPLDNRVSVEAGNITVAGALSVVLLDAGVDVLISADGHAALIERPASPVIAPEPPRPIVGSVVGRVTDAATGAGLSGASVLLAGTDFGAVTGNDGRYRIADVPAGTYTVVVQQLGYADARTAVTVSDGRETAADFTLEVSAVALDEVVATGNIVQARLREMAVPVSVVTSEDIERRAIRRVDQLFRGAIPGVIGWDPGQYDYYTNISVRGRTGLATTEQIKTYIDGVEVAYSGWIATIDPNMIERVEVIRGPQASTLYGSDAIAGVMQIFTKKGTGTGANRPKVEASVSVSHVASDFEPADGRPLIGQQRHFVQVSGGSELFSYNVGGTYSTEDEWFAGNVDRIVSVFGGAKGATGPLSATFSVRVSDKLFHSVNPVLEEAFPEALGGRQPTVWGLRDHMIGITLSYLATPRWQHNLVLGLDATDQDYFRKPNLLTPTDTTSTLLLGGWARSTVRYHTTAEARIGEDLAAKLTAGAEYRRYIQNSGSGTLPGPVEGSLTALSANLSRQKIINTGLLGQVQLGFRDAFFLNAGIRSEANTGFGEDYGRALAPRLGATYVQDLGNVDLKLRTSWGKGIRPGFPWWRLGSVSPEIVYLPNEKMGPEEQKGWEVGVDAYWGSRASFNATYYDQDVTDLIDRVSIDLAAEPSIYQYQNIGEVKNSGWELEGTLNLGQLSLQGTYSVTNSTVEKLSPDYTGDLQPGDESLLVPENTAGLTATYRFLRGSAGFEMSRIGSFTQVDQLDLYGFYYGGEPYKGSMREYWKTFDGRTYLNLQIEQALTDNLHATVRLNNLTDIQEGELSNSQLVQGRTSSLELRASF